MSHMDSGSPFDDDSVEPHSDDLSEEEFVFNLTLIYRLFSVSAVFP